MSPAEERRRSTLTDEHIAWSAPAKPAPATESAPPPRTENPSAQAPKKAAADQPMPARGRAHDPAEARGRKQARDAAYAWAAASAKAVQRLHELTAELESAMRRGTPPSTLAEYVHEACARYGIEADDLPTKIRSATDTD